MTRKQKKSLIRILAAAALLAACLILRRFAALPWWAELIAFAVPYLISGYDVLLKAVRNIAHGQIFDENFLMSLATVGAFAVGEYPEAAAVMIFYQIGELFQSIAVGKSRKSIAALMDIKPDHANVIRNGETITVSPEEVAVGELILVKAGERIPLDGVIESGSTVLNTVALTGESAPREAQPGETVLSGSVNVGGVIRIRTTGVYADSTVAKVLELVERSSEKKARSENFITRFAKWYTPAVVAAAVLLAVVPPLLFHGEWSEWIHRALIFLVVSCPCALVVSVPLTFFCGMGGASKRGILIKGSNHMETLAKTGIAVFDKTGTLTKGSFEVSAVHANGMSRAELLDIAALAESYSDHPIARSIVRAHGGHLDPKRAGEVEELSGLGIRAVIDGKTIHAGSEKLMESLGITPFCREGCRCGSGACVHVASDEGYCGHILISDEVKPTSAGAISKLRGMGIKTVMLTGDAAPAANETAAALRIDEARSGLLPAGKVEAVEALLEESGKRKVIFAGDGINDAPVLARADAGLAMGALGSDAAIEAADIVIADDDPVKVPLAINISKRTLRIVLQNIVYAIAVKLIVLILGALGIANMWIAVFADVGVAVLAILNAIRAMKTPNE